MSKIQYEMKPVTEKREKPRRSSSIFDPIITEFMNSGQDLVEVTVEGREASYMKTQLVKRLAKRELDVEVTLGYGVIYLEKKKE